MSLHSEAQHFIQTHTDQAIPLEKAYCEAIWGNNTAQGVSADEVAHASIALRKLYSDNENYSHLQKLLAAKESHTKKTHRQLTLLELHFQGQQMKPEALEAIATAEAKIDAACNTFRVEFEGKPVSDNELLQVLAHEVDCTRRFKAWDASKALGKSLQKDVIDLVKKRNAAAKALGYRDYYAFSLANQEIDETWFFEMLDDVAAKTDAPFAALKGEIDQALRLKFGLAEAAPLAPWHYSDPFFQKLPSTGVISELEAVYAALEPEPAAAAYFRAIGLPVEAILDRSDLYERQGKNQHAFCLRLDREGDVRILTNLRKTEGWMSTLLHELGHAVYDEHLDAELPWLLREVSHALMTEAVALYMERLTRDGHFLNLYAGLSPDAAHDLGARAAKSSGDQLLVFTRWSLVMIHFERALFQNPDQDLNALWWQLVERYQGIPMPVDRQGAGDWAAKIHIATAPVYYQNYLLGEMVASQFAHHLKTEVLAGMGPDAIVRSEKVGAFFKSAIFKPGAQAHWQEHLAQATDGPLNAGYHTALMVGPNAD